VIELLVDLRERQAIPALRLLLNSQNLDENVKKRVQRALQQLG
jgi:hypothetical protein